jgi:tRNA dimethylallyltransferase
VISLDASQVYRGFDIGTGKISHAEQRGVPHHLLSNVEPDEHFDAGVFSKRADELIAEISARGKRVVICGGTGFYLVALLRGLCEAPRVSSEVDAQLKARIEAGEVETLHAELSEVDPTSAAKIMPRDKQRIQRALGVYLSGGKSLTTWHEEQETSEDRYPALILGLDPPRELLNKRIALRVDSMWDQGFLEEVRELRDAGYTAMLNSMGAIGYRLALAALEGDLEERQAREKMLFATRQYARRQRRFFDRQLPTQWVEPVKGAVKINYDDVATQIEAWWGEDAGL